MGHINIFLQHFTKKNIIPIQLFDVSLVGYCQSKYNLNGSWFESLKKNQLMGFPTMRFELQLENPFISNYIKLERKELNLISYFASRPHTLLPLPLSKLDQPVLMIQWSSVGPKSIRWVTSSCNMVVGSFVASGSSKTKLGLSRSCGASS